MRVPINLASDPFRRDRPMLFAFAVGSGLLVVSLLVLISMILSERGQVAETRAAVDRYSSQLSALQTSQSKLDATLRQPGNAVVLERSVLLNQLIQRKAISWTKIFSDLEKVLPANVRLVQIRMPQVNSANEVTLDMIVGAQSPEPVLDLVRKLEDSQQFTNAWVGTFQGPSQNDPLFKYRVTVTYAQRL